MSFRNRNSLMSAPTLWCRPFRCTPEFAVTCAIWLVAAEIESDSPAAARQGSTPAQCLGETNTSGVAGKPRLGRT